jgi:hypothetical protein
MSIAYMPTFDRLRSSVVVGGRRLADRLRRQRIAIRCRLLPTLAQASSWTADGRTRPVDGNCYPAVRSSLGYYKLLTIGRGKPARSANYATSRTIFPRDRHERLLSCAALASTSGYLLSIRLFTRPCAISVAICANSSPLARTSTKCALGLRPSVARRRAPVANEASAELTPGIVVM